MPFDLSWVIHSVLSDFDLILSRFLTYDFDLSFRFDVSVVDAPASRNRHTLYECYIKCFESLCHHAENKIITDLGPYSITSRQISQCFHLYLRFLGIELACWFLWVTKYFKFTFQFQDEQFLPFYRFLSFWRLISNSFVDALHLTRLVVCHVRGP